LKRGEEERGRRGECDTFLRKASEEGVVRRRRVREAQEGVVRLHDAGVDGGKLRGPAHRVGHRLVGELRVEVGDVVMRGLFREKKQKKKMWRDKC